MTIEIGAAGTVVRVAKVVRSFWARKRAVAQLQGLILELQPRPTAFRIVTEEIAAGALLGVERGVLVKMHHNGEMYVRLVNFADGLT